MANESSSCAITDAEKKIIRQVEYYFGDMNLPKDKFLQEESKKDDGWVPIQILTTFNRMKALTTDVVAIVAALKKSENDIVEINEENTKIRRCKSKPLPENRLEFWKQLKERTLYVKGFPGDIQLDALMEFFEKHGKVENLFMRRLKDAAKTFKGSVFVTFQTHDMCKSFLALESVKYNETELIKMFEAAYHSKKNEERRLSKTQKQQDKDAVKQHQKNKNKEQNGKEDKNEAKFTTGLVIHVTNLDSIEGVDRDSIKQLVQKHAEVDWIDFNRGDKEAWIRIKGEENAAKTALDKLKEANDGKFVYKETEFPAEVLTGEVEVAYWVKTRNERREAFNRKNANKRKFNKKDRNQERFKKGGKGYKGDKKNQENGKETGGKETSGGKNEENCNEKREKEVTGGKTNEENGKEKVDKESAGVKRAANESSESSAAKVAKVE